MKKRRRVQKLSQFSLTAGIALKPVSKIEKKQLFLVSNRLFNLKQLPYRRKVFL